MSEHHKSHDEHAHHHHQQGKKKPFHQDWRVWVGVALMLAAMIAYIMSLDEELVPGGGIQQPVPADAGP